MQTSEIPSEYIKPHYSTKLIKSIYNYFLKYYSEDMINRVFDELKMSKTYFLNDDNWHSNELNKQLCDKIISESGDSKILFNIGKELLQPQNINFLEYQILKLLPPFILFRNLPIQASKINNVFKLNTTKARPGHFRYEIELPNDIDIHLGVLDNTEGCLHAFKEFCNLENFSVVIEHNQTPNSKIISYNIRYTALKYWATKIVPTIAYLLTTLLITNQIMISHYTNITAITAATFVSSMLLGLATFLLGKKIISLIKNNELYYTNTKEKNQKIYEKTVLLENKLNEEQYIKNICLTLIKAKKVEDIIDDSLNSICQNPKYEKAMVMLASERNNNLKTASVRGIESSSVLKNLVLTYPAKDQESQLFANILDSKKAILISDIDDFKKKLKKENQALIDSLAVHSLIVSPIGDSERSFGLLVIGSTDISTNLTISDLKFIEHISSLMSLFFQKSYTLETESTLRTVFEKYVPKNVLLEMDNLKDKNSWRIPPQSKHVASMFIDLRGFTNVSEHLAPENVFKMLDLYFEEIANIVGSRGGIIDNIIADEMVVFFPKTNNNKHCSDALLTAIEISAQWSNIQLKVTQKGLPKLSVGIGLHSGMASIGTVGSDVRSNYTCLGDTINSASRIQKLTRKYFPNDDSAVILTSDILFREAEVPIKFQFIENEIMRGRKQLINLMLIKQSDSFEFSSFLRNLKGA